MKAPRKAPNWSQEKMTGQGLFETGQEVVYDWSLTSKMTGQWMDKSPTDWLFY